MPLRNEQRRSVPAEATADLSQALLELVALRWSSYRKALKRARKKFSEKSVHALRVEIRRTLSTLALLGAILADELIMPLQDELKDRLKALSRLRDTHVQLDTVEELAERSPELEPLRVWLRRKERRLSGQVERQLAEMRLGKTARLVNGLTSSLTEAAQKYEEKGELKTVLVRATGRAFNEVQAKCRQVSPDNIATIHRTRLAFKKFRYMVEALAKVLPGFTEAQLKAMQAYQTRMGEIQDVEVLLKRAEKFARQANLDDLFFEAFRRNQLRRRARLVRKFLKSADELADFWPLKASRRLRPKAGSAAAPSRPTLQLHG